jgi:hypothetical protein
MRTNRLLGAAFFLGLAACGTSPLIPTGSGGSGGSTSSTSSGGGEGGGATCNPSSSIDLLVTISPPAGMPTATCTGVETVTFDGMVRTKDGDIFVDTCGPAADCLPSEIKISVLGSAFTSDDAKVIPDGTFVHGVWTVASSAVKACADAVLLRNLPTWQGVINPTASHTSLWLFATNAAPFESVGADDDRTALTVEEGVLCNTKDLEPSSSEWIKLTATDAKVSVQASPDLRATLTIPSGAQKGDYAVLNDVVGTVGNQGFLKSYAILRQAP